MQQHNTFTLITWVIRLWFQIEDEFATSMEQRMIVVVAAAGCSWRSFELNFSLTFSANAAADT